MIVRSSSLHLQTYICCWLSVFVFYWPTVIESINQSINQSSNQSKTHFISGNKVQRTNSITETNEEADDIY